ncbi:MAG: exopolysaccharide biosynthesis polyprenyl glycosylphosphotransferase [Planctomycetota bacterium]
MRRLAITFVVLAIAALVADHILSEPGQELQVLIHALPVAAAILIALYIAEIIGVTTRPLPPLSIEKLFWALGASCLVMAAGYALLPTYAPSPFVACGAPVAAGLAIYLQRRWVESRGFRDDEVPAVLFASSREGAIHGLRQLRATPAVRVRGIILPCEETHRDPIDGLSVLAPRDGFDRYRNERIPLFAIADATTEDLRTVLAPVAGAGCTVEKVEHIVAKAYGRVHLGAGDDIALISRLTHKANLFSTQRLVDTTLVLLASPLFLLAALPVALAVKLTSPGPAIYRQKRVGRWGREFTILKFRTMHVDAEQISGPVWATTNDPRVTRIGNFLRTTRLDEIPQLLNVLRGDMSLVGPRPERRKFVDELKREIPFYDARHAVRPGLTGWAQIRYQYGSNIGDARRKLEYELFYIVNRSLSFYLAVLLETVKVILFRRGSR